MAKPKRMKIVISNNVKEKLESPFRELISRGAEGFDLSELISNVLSLPEAGPIIDEFVDEHTPESYKINQLLNNPEERSKVLDLLKNKTFGLNEKSSVNGQSSNL